jgi:hypothetical protein
MHAMVPAGYPVQNLVNTEEFEAYLRAKGMVEVSEHEVCTIPLELTFRSSTSSGGQFGFGAECQRPRSNTESKGHYPTSEVAAEF